MAACRLAAKGRSLADSSYEAEVKSIEAFLQMQHPAPALAINPSSLDILPEDYIAPRFVRKLKGKVRILIIKQTSLFFLRVLIKNIIFMMLTYILFKNRSFL